MKHLREFSFIRKIDDFFEDSFDDFRIGRRKLKYNEALTQENRLKYQKQEHRGLIHLILGILVALLFSILSAFCIVMLVFGISRLPSYISERLENIRILQEEKAETETDILYEETDITIGCTGSIFLHLPITNACETADGTYDFSPIFTYIEPYFNSYDFITCEFEGTLSGGNYSGYPTFRAPDSIMEAVRDSGIDLVMLASNHAYDDGTDSFHRTMDVCDELGVSYTGICQEDSEPWFLADICGVCVGFLDYTYESSGYNYVNLNGIYIPETDQPLINSFSYSDLDSFYAEAESYITEMREEGARFIIMNLHWGDEYQLSENKTQREIAQALCDLGVDALIGGHTHCLEPIDVFEASEGDHQMFCIFSTGNLLSNQRTYLMQGSMPSGHTEDGVIVSLNLHQSSSGNVSITDVEILPLWVYLYSDENIHYYILPLDDVDNIEIYTGLENLVDDARASYNRTLGVLEDGLEKAQLAFSQ